MTTFIEQVLPVKLKEVLGLIVIVATAALMYGNIKSDIKAEKARQVKQDEEIAELKQGFIELRAIISDGNFELLNFKIDTYIEEIKNLPHNPPNDDS